MSSQSFDIVFDSGNEFVSKCVLPSKISIICVRGQTLTGRLRKLTELIASLLGFYGGHLNCQVLCSTAAFFFKRVVPGGVIPQHKAKGTLSHTKDLLYLCEGSFDIELKDVGKLTANITES